MLLFSQFFFITLRSTFRLIYLVIVNYFNLPVIPLFSIQNIYCEVDNYTVINSNNKQENFNIELNISDADLLELKQELNRI